MVFEAPRQISGCKAMVFEAPRQISNCQIRGARISFQAGTPTLLSSCAGVFRKVCRLSQPSRIPLGHLFGAHVGSIWELVVPSWHRFGVLEAPVYAHKDLLGSHCDHVKVWVRFEVNFEACLGP